MLLDHTTPKSEGWLADSESIRLFLQKLNEVTDQKITDPKFSVSQLAVALGMSRAHLTRKLTAIIKCPPGKYILFNRLELAAQLLVRCNEPIKNIAWMAGFQSYSSFWRAFIKEFECSPSDYRPKSKQADLSKHVFWEMPPTLATRKGLSALFYQKPRIADFFQILLKKIEDEGLTLDSLSESIHISSSQLLRDIKSSLGVTPMRLLLQFRLLYAAELLGASSLSIAEVAHQAGFFDQAHLSRAFKEVLGISPSSYKRGNHKEEFLLWLKTRLMRQEAI